LPQRPQWALSVCTSRHAPEQLSAVVAQVFAQAPSLQSWPAGQAMPQRPQWLES